MKTLTIVFMLLFSLSFGLSEGATTIYENRWVYVSRGLARDQDVTEIKEIVETASQHGLNGMVLAAGLGRISLWRRIE